MPNWVTTQVSAPKHVIESMINEAGRVDFNLIIPVNLPHAGWECIIGDAETAAKRVLNTPLSKDPLIGALEAANRADVDVSKLLPESFSQFTGMLENYRATGYLHEMDFARKEWGTKWNASDTEANPDVGKVTFETAWSCPLPVIESLSKKFPTEEIKVRFADEDIGSNCGEFALLAGEYTMQNIAPSWREMTHEQQQKWCAFAYEVKGWTPDVDEVEGE